MIIELVRMIEINPFVVWYVFIGKDRQAKKESLKLCSDQAKAKAKARIFSDACRLFIDLFRLFFI